MNSSIQKGGYKITIIIKVHLTLIADDPEKRKKQEEREKTGLLSATGILLLCFPTIHSGMGPLGSVGGISDRNLTCNESMTYLFLENPNSRLIQDII
jgi:hypothetical protein